MNALWLIVAAFAGGVLVWSWRSPEEMRSRALREALEAVNRHAWECENERMQFREQIADLLYGMEADGENNGR